MSGIVTTAYSYVNESALNNFTDIIQATNTAGGGYLYIMINFLIFFIILITLSSMFTWEAGLLTAGFIGFLISFLFLYMGVLSWHFVGMFVGIILFTVMYIAWANRNN